MTIIVTGGAGFIGSNIIKALNNSGEENIILVDDLTDGKKFKNIADLKFQDYIDKDNFILILNKLPKIRVIFHEGACSDTTEWNGKFMLENNYEYSKILLDYCDKNCDKNRTAFIYASSAAVYGLNTVCKIDSAYESPLNVYGYSKLLFDHYVRKYLQQNKKHIQIAGLRYFNVYGPREQHKGKMASVAFHHYQQLSSGQNVKLFQGSGGYADGEQRRDFVYVKDIAKINLWLWENPDISGIFNIGTGKSQSFNDVARAVIQHEGQGQIEYIPFPEHLKNCYQHFTEADISELRRAGYTAPFFDVGSGVKDYLDEIQSFPLE